MGKPTKLIIDGDQRQEATSGALRGLATQTANLSLGVTAFFKTWRKGVTDGNTFAKQIATKINLSRFSFAKFSTTRIRSRSMSQAKVDLRMAIENAIEQAADSCHDAPTEASLLF
jgi:hypothetical protein